MLKFRFKKLVRDNIVHLQLAQGAKPLYWQLSDDEHAEHLVKKVIEEVQEVTAATKGEVAAELADVQQALDDLRDKLGITPAAVAEAQSAKAAKYGKFEQGVYVDHVEVPEDNAWVEHFRSNPERYPEL